MYRLDTLTGLHWPIPRRERDPWVSPGALLILLSAITAALGTGLLLGLGR